MTALLVVAGFGIRFFFAAQDTHERGNQERIARTAEITDAIDTGIENGDLQLRRPGETYPPAAPAADVAPGAPDLAAFDDPTDAWLVWAAAEPDATNAVLDATGEHCALNQPADTVWFLAGSFGETLERECAVPHGRTLVVPAINSWCPADDFEVCREANSWMNEGSAGIELDGERVGPNKARQSPILRFDAAIDNPMLPAGPNETQMIGQWAVIDPPAPGVHTLRITAEAEDFAIDVTYTLTIG